MVFRGIVEYSRAPGMEETFAEKVMLELALEGKSVFIILLLLFFFFPDAILELEWD